VLDVAGEPFCHVCNIIAGALLCGAFSDPKSVSLEEKGCMFRFLIRRVAFIVLICLLIVFFSHLGMRMIRNSEISRPDYDVVKHGQLAWQDTLASFAALY
jgi:hypothetical protein